MPSDIHASFGMAPGVNPVFPAAAAFEVDVETPDGHIHPVRSPELAVELERRCGEPVTLRFSERGLYDCRPLSIFGNATAKGLGEELGIPIDRRRFRANFYVDWLEGRPFHENHLVGRTLQIGDRLRIVVIEPDPRCKMITIDPDTAVTNRQILHHVIGSHQGTAGVYAAVLTEGIARKGDAIRLMPSI
jgi:MOSC domain-containing protein